MPMLVMQNSHSGWEKERQAASEKEEEHKMSDIDQQAKELLAKYYPAIVPSDPDDPRFDGVVVERAASGGALSAEQVRLALEAETAYISSKSQQQRIADRLNAALAAHDQKVREEIRNALICDQTTGAGDYDEAVEYADRIVGKAKENHPQDSQDKPRTGLLLDALAAWMIANSFATGHGDTPEDLLGELRWQIEERVGKVREQVQRECLAWVRGYAGPTENDAFITELLEAIVRREHHERTATLEEAAQAVTS